MLCCLATYSTYVKYIHAFLASSFSTLSYFTPQLNYYTAQLNSNFTTQIITSIGMSFFKLPNNQAMPHIDHSFVFVCVCVYVRTYHVIALLCTWNESQSLSV